MRNLRDLSDSIRGFSNVDESTRVVRGTLSLLRCFFFFDLCWLLSGIGLIILAVTNSIQTNQRSDFIVSGAAMGFFASISALVNSLASHGIRTWRRGFLVPWLAYFLIIFSLMVIYLANSVYENHFQWRHIFLFLGIFAIYSCWRHMYRQYRLMSRPRPEQVVMDVESLVRVMRNSSTGQARDSDLPPKYEELEDVPPPQYSSVVGESERQTQQTM